MRNLFIIVAFICCLDSIKAQDDKSGYFASINGMEMYYQIHGNGDPLVLLHGFFQTGEWWRFAIEDLSKQFKLIIPDLRGHGRSTNPLEHWTMAQSAKDIMALMDYLEIEKFNSIGASTGAKTLLHIAIQEPQRIQAMILIGGTMYYPEQFRNLVRLGHFGIDKVTAEGLKKLRLKHIYGDEQIRKLYRQFNEFADDYEDMALIPPRLKQIKARTLVIHGDNDFAYPVEMATEIYRSIPNAHLWIVPNAAHWPFTENNYKVFLMTTLAFLTEWK